MSQLTTILLEISLPIIILIGLGFAFQKIAKLDVKTLPRVLIYLIVPVVIFTKIYRAEITPAFFGQVALFVVCVMASMLLISLLLGRMLRMGKGRRHALNNAMVMFNTGNYGIPLIELVFAGNPLATASQLFIVIIQNLSANTFVVYMASSGSGQGRSSLLRVLKMPAIYTLVLAAVLNFTGVSIPKTVMIPLDYITSAFIAVALIALGMQLAQVRLRSGLKDVVVSTLVKTIAAPLLGFGFVLALGIQGMLAQALVIGISTPVAVTTAIFAREFDNEADYAAQMVLSSTLLCTFTLPLVIWFVQSWFV